jgi:Holliday junction resolvasome RuvABC endonuclease subunit
MNYKKTCGSTILGIDPGARQIGIAVMKDDELVFYAVKTFKKGDDEEKLKKLRLIIEKLVTDYRVEYVALEKIVFVQQHRSFVKIVYDKIKEFLKERNIELFEYNPKVIRQIICDAQKPTKRNTALILAQKHAELVKYFNVAKLWQKRYFAQLFDAIAAAQVCAKELRETNPFLSKSAPRK